MISSHSEQRLGEERQSRIVIAALEVFSKSSFGNATTDEIARRARVSKRDIYAAFPDKHAILTAAIDMVLQSGDENLRRVISDSQRNPASAQEALELIGLALVSEILSPSSGFVLRLVSSESFEQTSIGSTYFERWYVRRSRTVGVFFSKRLSEAKKRNGGPFDSNLASRHFLGLVTHLPQLTACIGIPDPWNSKSIQAHVRSSVECFLKAYPDLARK
jgi:AcrR family transcriptional regulator